MDKRGNPNYLRLPLTLEAAIEKLSRKEGRSKNDMIVRLISIGVHALSFDQE